MCKFLFDVFPLFWCPGAFLRCGGNTHVSAWSVVVMQVAKTRKPWNRECSTEWGKDPALLMVACTTATWPARQSARHDGAARDHAEKM